MPSRKTKYKVKSVPFNLTDDELAAVLLEYAAGQLAYDRYELHSMHQIDGRGIVLIFWRDFRV